MQERIRILSLEGIRDEEEEEEEEEEVEEESNLKNR
jgi:hypothetical protein